jgi:hypothetical protein
MPHNAYCKLYCISIPWFLNWSLICVETGGVDTIPSCLVWIMLLILIWYSLPKYV